MDKQRPQTILENPSMEDAYAAIRWGLSRHRTVIVVGSCRVNYEGRASSTLEPGERVLVLKSDGSALVHRPRDYAPVNWQPPGSLYRTRLGEGVLTIRVFRRREKEALEVSFDDVILIAALQLRDAGAFHLYASEEDMKQAILVDPSLLEEGFRPITAERPVEPGFIDILGVDMNGVLTVVEIKRKPATKEAALQLKRYLDVLNVDPEREVRGILVAPDLVRGAQRMLATFGLEFKALSPQRCVEVLRRGKGQQLTDFLGS